MCHEVEQRQHTAPDTVQGSWIGMIEKSLSHMIDMVVGLFEEGGHMVIVHQIVDRVAFASWFDQAAIP
jgi:hypothetical protein